MFCQKSVLKYSLNSQEIICVRVSFLIKWQAEASNLIKKENLEQELFCEFSEIFKKIFLLNTSGQLLCKKLQGSKCHVYFRMNQYIILLRYRHQTTSVLICNEFFFLVKRFYPKWNGQRFLETVSFKIKVTNAKYCLKF